MARVLSHQIEAIEYRHADDGLPYRHDFERDGTDVLLLDDGSVKIQNRDAELWDVFTMGNKRKQPFLVNPRGRRDRMATKKKRAKRSPPKGYKTWKAYMASIRPNAPKKARRPRRRTAVVSYAGAAAMPAKKKHHRRRRNPASNPPRRHHRRRRSNPPFGLPSTKSIIATAIDGVTHGAVIVAAKGGVRAVRKQFGYTESSVIGTGIEAGLALAIGMFAPGLLSRVIGREHGRAYALTAMRGAFAAPIENLVKQAKIPFLSENLGDAGMFDTSVVMLPSDSTLPNLPMSGYSRAPRQLSGYSAALMH